MKTENKGRHTKTAIFITFVLTAILFTVGAYMLMESAGLKVVNKEEYQEYKKAYDDLGKSYYIKKYMYEKFLWKDKLISPKKLEDQISSYMLSNANDEYSMYLDKSALKALDNTLNSRVTGIGILIGDNDSGEHVITEVIKNSPAEAAGLKRGDIIKAVDDEQPTDYAGVITSIRGEPGTKVKLNIKAGDEERQVNIVRGKIDEGTTIYRKIDNGVGYIKILSFGETTAKEFRKAEKEFIGGGVKSLVIDLRGNGGGLFDQSIKLADRLLGKCVITSTKDASGKKKKYKSGDSHTTLKYVLLVDENTASASEVLAGAVKDNNGGSIVGTKTFGKGIVQEVIRFKDKTGMTLTTMEYFLPSGENIHKKGIQPDFEIKNENTVTDDKQLKKALEILKG